MDKDLLKNQIMNMKHWLVSIRRDFHMHPELGLEEYRTSDVIKKYLKEMNIEYETYEGQTAVVGIIYGKFPGKTVGIRADMDALPITESNEVSYKSQKEGVMHACGHDAHVTMLLGAAKILSNMQDELHGNIKLFFQTIVSRNVSPLDSAVLTLGTINGGVKGNVIAHEVKIRGTLRTIDPDTRVMIKERIKYIVESVAKSFGGEGFVEIEEGYAALINSSEVVEVIINTVKENFGEGALVIKDKPSLGVEDFSYFIDASKGAFYHLGCGNVEKKITAPLHNSCFDIDEECLPLGVLAHTLITLNLLNKK